MRRSDREMKDREEILKVMERCDVCRLALHDQEYPYILPLNFGMKATETELTLYFHGASEGKKYELMARDNRASFEMDCNHQLFFDEKKCNCTMAYESVIGYGRLAIVPEEEKPEALAQLMQHYHGPADFSFEEAIVRHTVVMKLTVEGLTGKCRPAK